MNKFIKYFMQRKLNKLIIEEAGLRQKQDILIQILKTDSGSVYDKEQLVKTRKRIGEIEAEKDILKNKLK